MLALALYACGWAVARVPPHATLSHTTLTRARAPRCDSDRCYYGRVDANGEVLEQQGAQQDFSAVKIKPNPSLSALEVVDAQFQQLSLGTFSGVEAAHEFVSPAVVEKYSMDAARFRSILESAAFDGLIGCASWKVVGTRSPTEDLAIVSLVVLPKPIAGCVRTSGIAEQGGISWPTNYAWHLARQTGEGPLAGCWMLEQMAPEAPPIDVDSADGTPRLADGDQA